MESTTGMPCTRIYSSLKPRARPKKAHPRDSPTESPPPLRVGKLYAPRDTCTDRPCRWDVPLSGIPVRQHHILLRTGHLLLQVQGESTWSAAAAVSHVAASGAGPCRRGQRSSGAGDQPANRRGRRVTRRELTAARARRLQRRRHRDDASGRRPPGAAFGKLAKVDEGDALGPSAAAQRALVPTRARWRWEVVLAPTRTGLRWRRLD